MTSRATTPRRVALVTGGTGGIGGGVVTALTQRGFDLVVSDRAMDPAAADTLKARAAADARLAFVTGDVADLTDHPRVVDAAFAAFGRVDSLVNNAGVSVTSRGDRLDVSVDSYDLNFAVNTRGAFFHTQTVCRRMLEAEPHGAESARSIIFVSSSNAAIAAPERGGLAPHGIVVDEVRPGLIKTPMTGVAQERFDTRLAEGFTPLNRWGTPEDIGRAVATLATGDLPFPTGAAIPVDGGMHLHSY
jgi:3-oxoacyl-[acyl-carrier protein] reductase